jgi:hypothetical protein
MDSKTKKQRNKTIQKALLKEAANYFKGLNKGRNDYAKALREIKNKVKK